MTDIMELIDAYAEARHKYGSLYNSQTADARKRVSDCIESIGAGGVSGRLVRTPTSGAADLPEALYADAVKFAKERASISYVQRKCRCSYNKAERMLEQMVADGIIQTYYGRKDAALTAQAISAEPAAHVQNPAEIEHVAGDVSKNETGSNTAYAAPQADSVLEDAARLLALGTDANLIFNNPPNATPQDVRDVIEWFSGSIRVILDAARKQGGSHDPR